MVTDIMCSTSVSFRGPKAQGGAITLAHRACGKGAGKGGGDRQPKLGLSKRNVNSVFDQYSGLKYRMSSSKQEVPNQAEAVCRSS
jgi:hypothetical protein